MNLICHLVIKFVCCFSSLTKNSVLTPRDTHDMLEPPLIPTPVSSQPRGNQDDKLRSIKATMSNTQLQSLSPPQAQAAQQVPKFPTYSPQFLQQQQLQQQAIRPSFMSSSPQQQSPQQHYGQQQPGYRPQAPSPASLRSQQQTPNSSQSTVSSKDTSQFDPFADLRK